MFKKKGSPIGWLTVPVLVAGGILIASCALFQHEGLIISPVTIPGASYVGMETCKMCHAKEIAEFRGAPHADFAVVESLEDDETPTGEGCESCHGPGSLHVEGRGDKSKILKGDYRTCLSCHLDKKAKFNMRYHHPVPEGRMSCTACHDPHKGGNPVHRVQEQNRTCFSCHPDKRGPWAFPHEAVTEDGCGVCHDPHGSSVDKLLTANVLNLCLKCHFQSDHPDIGGHGHASSLGRGGCTNCHMGIHGSNFSRSLRHE